jgi:hypothetical protein
MTLQSEPNAAMASNGETSRFRRNSVDGSPDLDTPSDATSDRLPSNRRNGAHPTETRDDLQHDKVRRTSKPTLQRSKSEYAPRQIEEPPQNEEGIPEWGARHGFEDHYQSEHIISQLANVGFAARKAFLLPRHCCPVSFILYLHVLFFAHHCQEHRLDGIETYV